jgi:CRISPR/Cas system-associated protein Csm6
MGNRKPACCDWAHSFFSEIERFRCRFQEDVRTIFIAESTVIGTFCVDVMEEWLIPQVENDIGDFIYQ